MPSHYEEFFARLDEGMLVNAIQLLENAIRFETTLVVEKNGQPYSLSQAEILATYRDLRAKHPNKCTLKRAL